MSGPCTNGTGFYSQCCPNGGGLRGVQGIGPCGGATEETCVDDFSTAWPLLYNWVTDYDISGLPWSGNNGAFYAPCSPESGPVAFAPFEGGEIDYNVGLYSAMSLANCNCEPDVEINSLAGLWCWKAQICYAGPGFILKVDAVAGEALEGCAVETFGPFTLNPPNLTECGTALGYIWAAEGPIGDFTYPDLTTFADNYNVNPIAPAYFGFPKASTLAPGFPGSVSNCFPGEGDCFNGDPFTGGMA